ncbi:15-hydroxyprostaglandin dehydrogenase [NAD(+)] isoform X1 [Pangasianodon hypophthalmus]|uniref:15-hydroxyprostaglandin dehydrogenase [NAD(+)] isoform X1 n=2 Tax=Pangasianodon hypophthalmus TaxID=310915 RepID=UPI002307571B|nr:15-hydroxyprostaglandin dehydrogenase [NAD(+)] isoform X1 [Pangasianodon hypophthalmus]
MSRRSGVQSVFQFIPKVFSGVEPRMLKGKVAVVSGSAQGLGKAFTHILLENGAQVAMLDVNEELGQELQVQLNQQYGSDRTQFYKADVSSDQQFTDVFQKILSKFGRIDIFCNNAGIADEKNWEKTVSINLSGVVRGTYLALDHMKKQNGGNGGVIINTASLAGLGPLPSAPIYTATKYGVVGFTRALSVASQALDYGVRINALCPSFVRTSLIDAFKQEDKTGQFHSLFSITETMMEKFPFIEAEKVAEAFLLLVKDESVNGVALVVKNEGAAYVKFPKEVETTPISL